jgi:sialic acid synthase SpsE
MVAGIREIEVALGSPLKLPVTEEADTMRVARRGIAAARDIAAGEILTEAMLQVKRPQLGASPMRFWALLGRPAPRAYRKGEAIEDGALINAAERS